jgi:hypothetical protein
MGTPMRNDVFMKMGQRAARERRLTSEEVRTVRDKVMPPSPERKRGGKKYQARCLEILWWLHAEGDIASLEVAEES